jgi:hypothetical protein
MLKKCFTNKNNQRNKKNEKSKPWFDQECQEKRRAYNKVRRKVNQGTSTQNDLVSASKENKRAICRAKASFLATKRQELRNSTKNSKEFWKSLGFKKKKDGVKASFKDIAKHFEKLNIVHENDTIPENDNTETFVIDDYEILDSPFTESEVQKVIAGLKSNKSPGEDLILNEFIKTSANMLITFYTNLFNTVFESGEVPEAWTSGLIIPIYKKGDPTDPSNYRGITLVSALGKVYTKLLNDRLDKFAEKYGIIKDSQGGFRKHNSTIDQVFVLQTLIDIFLKQNRKLYIAWIYYAKAFDSVWRNALWHKLIKSGISLKVVNAIKKIYERIKSKTFVHGRISDPFMSHAGVRQGESLSPFLFCIFINDLEEFLTKNGFNPLKLSNNEVYNYVKLLIVLYADDTAVVFSIHFSRKL